MDQSDGRTQARPIGRVTGTVGWALAGASLLSTILALTAFEPLLPDAAFDGSWRYAVAVASARSMAFGRDFVFTFGPLGMLYSGFRLPSQDALYLGFQVLLSVGLFAGFLLSARPARRPALILLPVAVAAVQIPDAAFFVMPLTLLVGCGRRHLSSGARAVVLALVAAADGVLPLIKGTMSLPVVGCTLLAAALLGRDRSPWAVAVPAVTLGTGLLTWKIAGQRFADLPAYLRSQSEVAAGYTDAMSVFGPPGAPIAFLAIAAALAAVLAASVPKGQRAATAAGGGLVCFVSLKAGFVRDDGHSLIAASMLALLGFLLVLGDPSARRAALGLIAGVGGWAWIAQTNLDVSLGGVASRFTETISGSLRSIARRMRHPDLTYAVFNAQMARIRDGFDVPDRGGTFDIYPLDQTLLLASGLLWAPRPIVQSYSAYTPRLAMLNTSHLESADAPDNILFNVQPLDDRYPTLDDGASWPAILSGYDYAGFVGDFAHLTRSPAPHPAVVGTPFLRRTVSFDEEVVLPSGSPENVWATLDLHPSLLGRIASLLFKRPVLHIDITDREGRWTSYRMVAGEGSAGFLLSPTVATARDFAALKLDDRALLADKTVRAFRLRQDGPFSLWGTRIDVALATLSVAPDPADRHDLRGFIAEGPPLAGLPAGGDCAIDAVGGQTPGEAPMKAAPPALAVEGWAMLSAEGKQENDGARVALTDASGRTFYAPAVKAKRGELSAYFGLSPQSRPAFSSVADLRPLHGAFTLHVVQDGPEGPVVCPAEATVKVP